MGRRGRKFRGGALSLVGKTPEGRWVLGGVYGFYETHGLPLDLVLSGMWECHNALPDWTALFQDMVAAGIPWERALGRIDEAVHDACCYPSDIREGIMTGLRRLADAEAQRHQTKAG